MTNSKSNSDESIKADIDVGADLAEGTLNFLLQMEEAVRSRGDLSGPFEQSFINQIELGTADLAEVALCLVELETAFPRPVLDRNASDYVTNLPTLIGRFEITGVLGSGSFGIVYRGWDPKLKRLVAVKVPRSHAFTSKQLRQRFVREAYAAAQLDHAHIVPIYEAGEFDDLPFIAYAYCEGPNLARWCNDQQELMTPKQAARLLLDLARAVAYSHSRGILHRDIKPSNVLLFLDDQGLHVLNGRTYTPKLTDLGLAKLMDADLQDSASTMMVGTPAYMSPEQGRDDTVGPASDVYSLGATLYFLLTGRPPFVAHNLSDLLRQLAECEPVEPSMLNPAIDVDLNTICVRCIEKQPQSRYESAQSLADDLGRYLAGLPILARPISKFNRIQRWCHRKPALAVMTFSVGVLALGLMGTLLMNSYSQAILSHKLEAQNDVLSKTVTRLDQSLKFAEQQKHLAEESALRTRQLLYVTDLQAASEAWQKQDYSLASQLLHGHQETESLREFAWRYLNAQLPSSSAQKINLGAQIWNIALSRDGLTAAVGDAHGRVHLLGIGKRLTVIRSWDTGQREINSVAFSHDGQMLATAGDDGRVGLWKAATGEHIRWLDAFENKPVFGVQFFDDSQKLVACGNTPELLIWELNDFQLLHRKATPHTSGIEALSVAPDGTQVATVGCDQAMRIFRLNDLHLLHELKTDGQLTLVQFDPAGKYIAAGGKTGWLYVWDAVTGAELVSYKATDPLNALSLGPENHIYFANSKGVIYHLDDRAFAALLNKAPDASKSVQLFVVHDHRPAGLARIDKNRFLTGNSRGELELWITPVHPQPAYSVKDSEPLFPVENCSVLPSADGTAIYRVHGTKIDRLNVRSKQQFGWEFDSVLTACYLTPDNQLVALGNVTGHVALLTLDEQSRTPTPRWTKVLNGENIDRLRTLKNGQVVIALSPNGDLVVYDMVQDRQLAGFPNRGYFDVSPDQQWIATGKGGTNELEIIDATTLKSIKTLPAHASTIWDVRFNADGSQVLTASGDRSIKIWSAVDWTVQQTLLGATNAVSRIAISADNQTIASCDESGKTILWYVATGQRTLEVDLVKGIWSCEFSADGQLLMMGTRRGSVHLLRANNEFHP